MDIGPFGKARRAKAQCGDGGEANPNGTGPSKGKIITGLRDHQPQPLIYASPQVDDACPRIVRKCARLRCISDTHAGWST